MATKQKFEPSLDTQESKGDLIAISIANFWEACLRCAFTRRLSLVI